MLPYRKGPSAIHGMGAFATRFIAKGDDIPMPPDVPEWIHPNFRGFNHSCQNNLGDHIRLSVGDKRIALRDIQPGEELTVNYHHIKFDGVANMVDGVYCHCDRCKGSIPARKCNCPLHRQ